MHIFDFLSVTVYCLSVINSTHVTVDDILASSSHFNVPFCHWNIVQCCMNCEHVCESMYAF